MNTVDTSVSILSPDKQRRVPRCAVLASTYGATVEAWRTDIACAIASLKLDCSAVPARAPGA